MNDNHHTTRFRNWKLIPLGITLIYLIVGGLWILLSDRALAVLVESPRAITRYQTAKGWFFIAATALMLYLLINGSVNAMARVREHLERSREQFRKRYEAISVGVVAQSTSGVIIEANHTACEILGLDREDILGRTHLDSIWQATNEDGTPLQYDQNPITIALRSGEPIRNVVVGVYSPANDTRKWIMLNTEPIKDSISGELREVIVTITDITRQKMAEEAVRESGEHYRLLFENNPEPMWVFDFETLAFLAVNNAAIKHYGYAREEFFAMTIKDIRPPEEIPALLEDISQLDRSVRSAGIWRHKKKDETIINVEITGQEINFNGQRAELVLAIDVTERLRAEQELRETSRTLQALVQASPVAIVVIDREAKVRLWNDAAERIFGWSEQEAIGQPLPFIQEDKKSEFYALFNKILNGESFTGVELRRQRKDGTLIDVALSTAPLRDDEGRVSSIMAMLVDITKQKQAARDLRDRKALLELVMDNIPQYIFWKDRNSVYMGCNKNFARVAGVENPEDIIGKTDHDLAWINEEADLFINRDRHVMNANSPALHLLETRHIADRSQIWTDSNKIPLDDAEGNVIGILGTFEDITERMKAQEEIRLRRESERTIREEAEDAKRTFYRGTIFSVTDGKLNLVEYDEIPPLLAPDMQEIKLASGDDLAMLRDAVNDIAERSGMSADRVHDLITAVGEAAANAIKHANGGTAKVGLKNETIQVMIADEGSGMDTLILPKATLLTRFSTKPSMGLGYSLILSNVDKVYLATGREGTCVLMEKDVKEPTYEFNLDAMPDTW